MPVIDFLERNVKLYGNETALVELNPELKEVFDAWICLKPSQKAAALQMLKAMSHDNE